MSEKRRVMKTKKINFVKIFFGAGLGILFLFSQSLHAASTAIDPSTLASWYGTSSTNDATSGGNTALGDFNGDGVNDIIMSAPAYSTAKGIIYIVSGDPSFSGSTLLSSANVNVAIRGTSNNDGLGTSIVAGDINADGYDDIISVGEVSGSGVDRIQVFLGSSSWVGGDDDGDSYYQDADAEASYTLETSTEDGGYDYLHLLGELDGAASGDFLAICNTTNCFLLPVDSLATAGSADTIESLARYQVQGIDIGNTIVSGDVDGDGNEDLILGEPDDSYYSVGATIFFGPLSSSSSLQSDASLTPSDYFEPGNVSGSDIFIKDNSGTANGFATSLSVSSILNSTYSDIIIGSPQKDSGTHTETGGYDIISGESIKNFRDSHSSTTGFQIYNDTSSGTYNYGDLDVIQLAGDADSSNIGYAGNAFVGADFNNDGHPDLALGGSEHVSSDPSDADYILGANYIVYGGDLDSLSGTESSVDDVATYNLTGLASGDQLSTNTIAGDVTGDGYDDLIVTAAGTYEIYLMEGGPTDLDSDGVDSDTDCNDQDATATTASTWYADADGDGFGDAAVTTDSCTQPASYVSDTSDCDDSDATISSTGVEVCEDGIDQDCDGTDLACAASSGTDADSDGVTVEDSDCDDTDSTVYPGATELGDAIDNDCDSKIDEGLVAASISSFPSSAAAGDSVDIDYDIINNSGLTDFEVEVLINNDVVGARETPRPSRAVVISNACVASRCNELNSEAITVADAGDEDPTTAGVTTSDTISATIPAGTAAGDYTLRIRIRDANTGQYFTRDLETIAVY